MNKMTDQLHPFLPLNQLPRENFYMYYSYININIYIHIHTHTRTQNTQRHIEETDNMIVMFS